jgi:1-acyl-sn-glycerol-3-phosphate acyltransferase
MRPEKGQDLPPGTPKPVKSSQSGKWLRLPYELFILYAGLFLFALICLIWSLIASVLGPVLPEKKGMPIGQFAIMAGFRFYLAILNLSGIVKLDLEALDILRDHPSLIIAPNHPSMIDVVLIASRLPRIVCIMKASIWDNLLLGGGARLAGYIRNDSVTNMVRLAAKATREGNQLLVFPEGTRTIAPPVNEFKPGFGLIAKKSGAPVQTVFIETNSAFLGKGWPLFKKPDFPLYYRIRLGERFEVTGDVQGFVSDLEQYFRQQPEIQHLPMAGDSK